MLLRPRQKLFVERSLAALSTHRNTLGVAPTASGKTVMLSAVAGELLRGTQAKAIPCLMNYMRSFIYQRNAEALR